MKPKYAVVVHTCSTKREAERLAKKYNHEVAKHDLQDQGSAELPVECPFEFDYTFGVVIINSSDKT